MNYGKCWNGKMSRQRIFFRCVSSFYVMSPWLMNIYIFYMVVKEPNGKVIGSEPVHMDEEGIE